MFVQLKKFYWIGLLSFTHLGEVVRCEAPKLG